MTKSTVIAEYVWLDVNSQFRTKARTLHLSKVQLSKIPLWNYDGSSTGQAEGTHSEINLKPAALFKCPFRKGNNIIVWCETHKPDGTPCSNNHRQKASELFNKDLKQEPWYGLEQEYFIIDPQTDMPLGFNPEGKQGQFYCSVGVRNTFGRRVADEHYQACLDAGVKISGINAEVAPGQWEFQVGPCEGIQAGDHLWIGRYLLERVAERNGVMVTFSTKPLEGDWNGSGCHCNYSTKNMRQGNKKEGKSGIHYITEAMKKLEYRHNEHMESYGEGNELRMTGEHETSDFKTFSYGVGNRGTSVRIPTQTEKDQCGYFEDRRPSSKCDPYLVTGILFDTTVLCCCANGCEEGTCNNDIQQEHNDENENCKDRDDCCCEGDKENVVDKEKVENVENEANEENNTHKVETTTSSLVV